jgi:hypothetical protein
MVAKAPPVWQKAIAVDGLPTPHCGTSFAAMHTRHDTAFGQYFSLKSDYGVFPMSPLVILSATDIVYLLDYTKPSMEAFARRDG